MKKWSGSFWVVVLMAGLFGCVSQPQDDSGRADNPPDPSVSAPAPGSTIPDPTPEPMVVMPPPPPATHSAVSSLVKQARSYYLMQDYQNAIASAERGLRIDRRAADLYLVLAQSYIQLALPQKANMFVQQGLRYAQQGSEVADSLERVQEIIRQGN